MIPWLYYDRDGQHISRELCAQLMCDPTYAIVAKTMVGEVEVSTVWLGLDHRHFSTQPEPLIFETMTFPDHDLIGRYPTEAAARAGHEAAVRALRAIQG